MSDASSSQSRVRNSRRNKIIITKCKKPLKLDGPKIKTNEDETKKVNGEFSDENKNKENDVIEVDDDVQSKEVSSKEKTKGKKRKLSSVREDDEVIIIEDSTVNEEKLDDENACEKKESGSIEFKGFKKRILSQTEQIKDPSSEISEGIKNGSTEEPVPEVENLNKKSKVVKINRVKKKKVRGGKKRIQGKDGTQQESQAEYAQYLGLQPTMQFKCYRCGEKGFPSMLALNMHQRTCGISSKGNFIANLQQDSSSSSDPNMLTNFRITRKVYLCSACGTYYENWNLFLHMRDVHKKHICLLCLTMFGMAEKLADHLKNTHTILESTFNSIEEFQSTYKGSCYLICCTCENMFNERGDYFHHQCVKRDPTAKCNLCGVKCGHYYTCPNSNQPRSLPVVTQPVTVPKTQASSLSKHPVVTPKNKASEELWMGSKETNFHDDDYDVSHAASFCHVDINDESGEKGKMGTKENPVNISDDENQTLKSSQIKSTRQDHNKKDKNSKNKVSEGESTKSKIKSALETILSKTSPEKCKNGKKPEQKNQSFNECESVEEPTNEEEYESNSLYKEDIEDVIGVKQSMEPLEINIDLDGEKEQLEKKSVDEIPTRNDHPQDISLKEQNVDHDSTKVQDSKPVSDKPGPSTHKDTDLTASDSDDGPVTHLSDGRDDSELSSEDENMSKKTLNKPSVDNSQDATVDERHNNKSSHLINEEINDLKNNSDDANNSSKENESRSDNAEELNSTTFDETSKVFNLEDVIGVKRPVENGEEDESSDLIAPEQSQTESEEINDGIALAGEEVSAMALTLEDKLDEASSQSVVKECVRTSCLNCVYCSHAIKIAVNGKQLALHLLAEHRYKPVKNNETSKDVVNKLKGSLNDLESIFFNTDSYDSSDKSLNTPYDYTYECFQCRYVTKIHKELYVHKRKMHQKTVLLCVMCKSNFYSYSELLCHMCPGIYASGDINFRCLFCNLDMIPSAFRLMVHLRKSHHTCDICLDIAGDQQKLSTHMWKHKLNHLCYRCGIAYRNKPDITKHLFWKHGTESVLCKKCLQKKWPHVYHFCIPPTVFICEECNASFTKAVALKVHKRFHSGEFPYSCGECDQHFVSRKLLKKHELSHNQPLPIENLISNKINTDNQASESTEDHVNVESVDEPAVGKLDNDLKENGDKVEVVPELKTKKKKRKDKDRKGKAVLDVYDLPPLNLSSESDSSDEESRLTTSETTKENVDSSDTKISQGQPDIRNEKSEATTTEPAEENQLPAPIVDGVWDNFHSYKAELEKRESKDLSLPNILPSTSSTEPNNQTSEFLSQPEIPDNKEPLYDWTQDHNYCLVPGKPKPSSNEEDQLLEGSSAKEASTEIVQEKPAPRGHSSSIDHAYATLNNSSGEGINATTEEPPSLDKPPTTPQTIPPAESQPSSKKKPKTPKKKRHDVSTHDPSIGNHSSTSSDSSSDTDSSCSCVSNCSCSDSSSSSSSSSSSGSDSSTSEGRRKATARREKKKERLKHKSHKEDSIPAPAVLPTPLPVEEPIVDVPVEPVEVPIRESDLDTDVSSTDEDFYDKYPQSHTKGLPIKRDLMLLASVAPVNNGTVSPPPPPPPPVEKSPQTLSKKRKVKTKKRRKSQQSKKAVRKSSLTHQQTQAKSSSSINLPMASSTPSQVTNYHNLTSKVASPLRTPATAFVSHTGGSGSENESARSTKRKRVRNKFYGYSSEEEFEEKRNVKWKKPETNKQPFIPPEPCYQPSTTHKPQVTVLPPKRSPSSESSGSDDEPRLRIKKEDSSNSSSSESEAEFDSKVNVQKEQQQTEKSDNLYCYCQCPYDEVSEMIACDGQDCTIEWFHFECVGIMVPPKGKWYCPDCRKRRDLM